MVTGPTRFYMCPCGLHGMMVTVTGKHWHDPFSKLAARQQVGAWLERDWLSPQEGADMLAQINASPLRNVENIWTRPPRYVATLLTTVHRHVVVLIKHPQATQAAPPPPPPAPPSPPKPIRRSVRIGDEEHPLN